ncbi:MAG: biopolymer transporter ExbD [Nitrospina sp.]|nr:MAG: biopolymer transporter ExbD [Nitrospina sp.]TDJ58825.1 MAG: biopolymer transporter ExbD [Nitrospina sp.]
MYFKREQEENYSLELTPLIDVVFLLLIFFMVSTSFVEFPRKMDIALPTSKAFSENPAVKNFEIEMTKDKTIYLDGKKVTLTSLEQLLEKIKKTGDRKALIRADKDIPYGEVVQVMGLLQAAEILDISVAVK